MMLSEALQKVSSKTECLKSYHILLEDQRAGMMPL